MAISIIAFNRSGGERRLSVQALALALTLATAAWSQSATAGDADGCTTCHGAKGASDQAGVPHLAGLNKGYLVSTLNNYLSGARPTAIKEHKENLTPELVVSLATAYSQLPWENAKGNVTDAAKVEAGEKSTTRCRLCHEDNGRSQEDEMPRMAGQKLDYLIDRLQTIKVEPKSTMPGKMMGLFRELTDDDIAAMAHFFAKQQ